MNQDFVNELQSKFDDWWQTKQHTDHPAVKDYNQHGDPDAGPIGTWPVIESFLEDNFPAAYRNQTFGSEGAGPLLDYPNDVAWENRPAYETGPNAVKEYGYDPREIAAGMLLLHNQSHPLRGDMAEQDQQRLVDIFTKRQQMQRAYEQRTAAFNQEFVDNLKREFHDWHKQQPKGSIFGGGMIGGLNEWPNIEKFLKDKYPAAHRNLNMGHEQAGLLMDGFDPSGIEGGDPYSSDHMPEASFDAYETGPEAINRYGYDPKEIAAGMLLLHNKTDRFRGDMSHEDQQRLVDIAQKRFTMQRDYEQRQNTAAHRTAMPAPMPEGITFHHYGEDDRLPKWMRRLDIDLETPAVEARHNGKPVGYLAWDYDRYPAPTRIYTHPDYRRQGIGTALWDFARQHEPDLQHSEHLTDLGELWVQHEQSRHADAGDNHTAHRTAMADYMRFIPDIHRLRDEIVAAGETNSAGGPSCGVTAEEVAEMLRSQGIAASENYGSFQHISGEQPEHAWVNLPDGTILDPTADQFGYEPVRFLHPDHPDHSLYRYQEGDDLHHTAHRTAMRSLDQLAQDGFVTDGWREWQQGGCIEYAHALKQRYPHLQVGIVSTPGDEDDWQHIFVHDNTHAYDSAGWHPLPYNGVHGQFEQHLGHDLDWYDEPDPELVEQAHRHIDRHGIGPKITRPKNL